MSEIEKSLNELLQRPIRRPEDAERAARAAEALAELLRAKEKAERILAGDSGQAPLSAEQGLAGMTLHDAAEAVLEEAGKPLHAKDIGERIKARGWKHPRGTPTRPDQIVYQLAARLPRHPQRFQRVAPNTFALAKWADQTEPSSRPPPKLGLFKGAGKSVGRLIGESPDAPAEAESWRSS